MERGACADPSAAEPQASRLIGTDPWTGAANAAPGAVDTGCGVLDAASGSETKDIGCCTGA